MRQSVHCAVHVGRLTAVCVHVIMPENIMYVYCELST